MNLLDYDHLVLTVSDIECSAAFYTGVLGMRREGNALHFGKRKINLHRRPGEFQPAAKRPTAGSADFCLICGDPIEAIAAELRCHGVTIELGPVPRNGAQGAMDSLYFRDPDGNLVELAVYR